MQLKEVYTQLGILFLLLAFGYFLGKIKVIAAAGIEAFSKFIVKVALPAIIISGMLIPSSTEKLHTAFNIFILSIGTYGLAIVVAISFSKFFIRSAKDQGVYRFAIVFSNAGFMGYPVIQAMLGKEAVFYTAIYNITFNLLLYTLGITLLDTSLSKAAKFNFKQLINPGVGASIVGLFLFITGLPLPEVLTGSIEYVASLCTPLSMIAIGAMLSSLPISSMFSNKRVYLLSVFRLIILPLLTLVLLKYVLRIDNTWLVAVPVIIAGMPVASNAAMMAQEYDNNAKLASQLILISTLFSCITIPLLMYLL